ncbi:MAG: FecR domain-containing protein [Rhodocyclaceae bacterium]
MRGPLVTILCSVAFSALSFSTYAQETAGQVQVVVGAAQLIDLSGKSRPLERGAEVKQGDRIVTGEGALVQMKMTDGALLSVRTDTDVTVEKYRHNEKSAQDSGMLLKLARGALRSITGWIGGNNPDAYKVVTPTATIGIRGTDHEPVFIPEPKPGEIPVGQPGTYDKVNSGATTIHTQIGNIDVKPGQVGFVPMTPGVAPRVLPGIPEFFKRLDPKGEPGAARGPKEIGDSKLLARPLLRPALDAADIKTLGTADTLKTERTLSPALIESAPTLQAPTKLDAATATPLQPAATTTLQPATTTVLQPATTLQPITTTIQPTTTLIAPTTTVAPAPTIQQQPTLNPMLTPKQIAPILLK